MSALRRRRCSARPLVAVVGPQVLLGTAAHYILDRGIHAARTILAGQVALDAPHLDVIAFAARAAQRCRDEDCGTRGLPQASDQRHGVRGPAEEIHPYA